MHNLSLFQSLPPRPPERAPRPLAMRLTIGNDALCAPTVGHGSQDATVAGTDMSASCKGLTVGFVRLHGGHHGEGRGLTSNPVQTITFCLTFHRGQESSEKCDDGELRLGYERGVKKDV